MVPKEYNIINEKLLNIDLNKPQIEIENELLKNLEYFTLEHIKEIIEEEIELPINKGKSKKITKSQIETLIKNTNKIKLKY